MWIDKQTHHNIFESNSFCVWLFVYVFIWLWPFPLFHFTYITVHSTNFFFSCECVRFSVCICCVRSFCFLLLSFSSIHTLRTWHLSCCSSGPCIWYICVARIFCFSVVVFAYEQCCFRFVSLFFFCFHFIISRAVFFSRISLFVDHTNDSVFWCGERRKPCNLWYFVSNLNCYFIDKFWWFDIIV